jgi:YidC/Oxa1 family membrane protein insertase
MKYDKTTIVGVAICVILFLSWNSVLRKLGYDPAPKAPTATAPAESKQAADATNQTAGKTTAGSPAPKETATTPDAPAEPVAAKPPPAPPASDALLKEADEPWEVPQASPVVLAATDKSFSLQVDPNGGGVTGVVLDTYRQDAPKGGPSDEPVSLGRPELPLCALNLAEGGWRGGKAEVVSQDEGHLAIRRAITGPGGETATLTEQWALSGPDNPYQFDYTMTVTDSSGKPVSLSGLALETGGLPTTTSPERAKFRGAAAAGVMVSVVGAKRPQGYTTQKMEKMNAVARDELRRDPTQWMAVHSQYFLFYVAAPEGMVFPGAIPTLETFAGDPQVKVGRQVGPQPWHRGRVLLPALDVATGGSAKLTFHCYAGPKKLQLLSKLDGGVAKIMDMDRFMFFHPAWMGWLTKLLLSCLVGLKSIFSGTWGYGWAIIVITVGVKVLFFPLSHKSTQSMRKMQELQPQLKELREKHKEDPQKMYRKQQELFKENNVSQLGGCLPMLVQIPVFFGLYNTFRSAIELRQASFLWVADLSLPDTLAFSPAGLPIRPLAIIMSGSMLLQQKLMPSADASQQRMMMFMSLFFLWIFYGMPAGLTLYWTTNQILTIAQTLITRRLEERKKAAEANSGDPVAGRA